jgi:sec-independent protein translocase protein TatA
MPGPVEWILIAIVVLVLFGAKKVPEMARALGRSSSEFKRGLHEGAADEDRGDVDPAE